MFLEFCSKSCGYFYTFQIEFLPLKPLKGKKKKKKVKLLQNLNPGSMICIRYDFFIIY